MSMYDNFRQIIDRRGVSPYRVAKDTGIPYSTLSGWKQGLYQPKLDKLLIIADYLEISLDELIGRE